MVPLRQNGADAVPELIPKCCSHLLRVAWRPLKRPAAQWRAGSKDGWLPESAFSLFPLRALDMAPGHSSYTQFLMPFQNPRRPMTRRAAAFASGTKAGTDPETFRELRPLSFRFCPKRSFRDESRARLRENAHSRNSTASSRAGRLRQLRVIHRGRLSTRF